MGSDRNTFIETGDRFVNIEGAINLRDFGGYRNEEGRTVRRGLLFRCGNMAEIPEHAFDDFAALNIGVICDLRSHEEAENSPTPAYGPFECRVHIPIWPGSSAQFQESVQNRKPSHDEFITFMRKVTREIARDHVAAYKQLMCELVSADRGFLLHCTAGKDRTGIGVALILMLLGVGRDTITHDYLVSNQAPGMAERLRARMAENAQGNESPAATSKRIIKILASVRAEYLHGAFEEIDRSYSGIEGYMEAIGVTASDEAHLREKLLD